MFSEKQEKRFGLCAERLHRLALDLAVQSSQMGNSGRGVAVVADECRNLANKFVAEYLELSEEPQQNNSLKEDLLELETLALNGVIESLRAEDSVNRFVCASPLTVIFDEANQIVRELYGICGGEFSSKPEFPFASPENPALYVRMPFLWMTVGKVPYTENLRFVNEIVRGEGLKETETGDGYLLRGRKINKLDFRPLPVKQQAPAEFFVITNTDYSAEGEFYAVPVDFLPNIFWTPAGVEQAHEPYLRAEWNCDENRKMSFLDYQKLKTR